MLLFFKEFENYSLYKKNIEHNEILYQIYYYFFHISTSLRIVKTFLKDIYFLSNINFPVKNKNKLF